MKRLGKKFPGGPEMPLQHHLKSDIIIIYSPKHAAEPSVYARVSKARAHRNEWI